jgi:hypothetical protein
MIFVVYLALCQWVFTYSKLMLKNMRHSKSQILVQLAVLFYVQVSVSECNCIWSQHDRADETRSGTALQCGKWLQKWCWGMILWSKDIKVKVKQSCYRPGVAQTVPGSYGSQISWQWHRMVVRLSALCTGRLYPQEMHLVLISFRGWVDPRAVVWPEGLCHWKIPMTPSGIEPATCRFVA